MGTKISTIIKNPLMRFTGAISASLAALLLTASPAMAINAVDLNPFGTVSAGRANLSGTATCDPGLGTTGQVTVVLRQTGPNAQGQGVTNVVCDGAPHSFAITVVGPFHSGPATANPLGLKSADGTITTTTDTVTLVP
jgi:hypothetical protein